ncbi:hypothetical protein JX266_009251 [Neoarthrinium moseri]|nr:hypothetical protein JX266_009251 [Neoarthrinium moseri]
MSRFRRLISTRRQRYPAEERDSDSDDSTASGHANFKEVQKDSWPASRRPHNRSRPPTPGATSKPQSLLNVSDPQPPLPGDTPRSSTSSAFSYERSGTAGSRSPFLCSTPSKHASELSLQLSSATSYDEDDEPTPLARDNDKFPRSRSLSNSTRLPRLRPDFTDALSQRPADKATGTYHQHLHDECATSPGFLKRVEKLSQEADAAFKPGRSFSQVDVTRRSFNETPRLPPLYTGPSVQRPALKPILKKTRETLPPQSPTLPVSFPRRTSSLQIPKRHKSVASRQMKTQRKSVAAKNAGKKDSKWTENVTDLLSGKLFHKIEADEMLTPAQIEAYKLKRLSRLQLQAAKSGETWPPPLDTESTETPIEPFHLDDLPLRIGSSGVKLTADTPIDEKPDPAIFNEAIRKDFSLLRSDNDDELFLGEAPHRRPSDPTSSASEDLISETPPQLPMKNPSRYMFRKIPELPTISETAVQDDELFLSRGLSGNQKSTDDENYVFFQSTPFTMTMPSFRHGDIRFARSDLFPEPRLGGADDGLDWTAFQMAISGGAGDFFTDSEHTLRRQEAEDIEALRDWWEEWGFENLGGLVTREDDPPSPSTISGSDSNDSLYEEIGRDNPYSPHHKWQRLRRKAAKKGRRLDLDLSNGSKLYNGGTIEKWRSDGHSSYVLPRESLVSMPQSPMLDLQVITSDNGDVDYVPMGYNLSHDLGDFLSWEAENVYSDGSLYDGGVI